LSQFLVKNSAKLSSLIFSPSTEVLGYECLAPLEPSLLMKIDSAYSRLRMFGSSGAKLIGENRFCLFEATNVWLRWSLAYWWK